MTALFGLSVKNRILAIGAKSAFFVAQSVKCAHSQYIKKDDLGIARPVSKIVGCHFD